MVLVGKMFCKYTIDTYWFMFLKIYFVNPNKSIDIYDNIEFLNNIKRFLKYM